MTDEFDKTWSGSSEGEDEIPPDDPSPYVCPMQKWRGPKWRLQSKQVPAQRPKPEYILGSAKGVTKSTCASLTEGRKQPSAAMQKSLLPTSTNPAPRRIQEHPKKDPQRVVADPVPSNNSSLRIHNQRVSSTSGHSGTMYKSTRSPSDENPRQPATGIGVAKVEHKLSEYRRTSAKYEPVLMESATRALNSISETKIDLRKEFGEVKDNMDQLKNDLESCQYQSDELSRPPAKSRGEFRDLSKELEKSEDSLRVLRRMWLQSQFDMDKSSSKAETLRKELDETLSRAAQLQSENDLLDNKLENSMTEKSALGKELEKRRSELLLLGNELNKNKIEKQSLSNEIEKSRSEKMSLCNALEKSSSENLSLSNELKKRNSEVKSLQCDVDRLTMELSKCKVQASGLRSQPHRCKKKAQTPSQQLQTSRGENHSLLVALGKSKSKAKSLLRDAEQAKTENQAMLKDLQDAQGIEQLLKLDLQGKVDTLEKDMERAQRTIESLARQADSYKHETIAIEKTLVKVDDENERLRNELQEHKKLLEERDRTNRLDATQNESALQGSDAGLVDGCLGCDVHLGVGVPNSVQATQFGVVVNVAVGQERSSDGAYTDTEAFKGTPQASHYDALGPGHFHSTLDDLVLGSVERGAGDPQLDQDLWAEFMEPYQDEGTFQNHPQISQPPAASLTVATPSVNLVLPASAVHDPDHTLLLAGQHVGSSSRKRSICRCSAYHEDSTSCVTPPPAKRSKVLLRGKRGVVHDGESRCEGEDGCEEWDAGHTDNDVLEDAGSVG